MGWPSQPHVVITSSTDGNHHSEVSVKITVLPNVGTEVGSRWYLCVFSCLRHAEVWLPGAKSPGCCRFSCGEKTEALPIGVWCVRSIVYERWGSIASESRKRRLPLDRPEMYHVDSWGKMIDGRSLTADGRVEGRISSQSSEWGIRTEVSRNPLSNTDSRHSQHGGADKPSSSSCE